MTDTNSVFLDEIGMKYLMLNVFTLDPIHDFSSLHARLKKKNRVTITKYDELIKILDYKLNNRIKKGGSNNRIKGGENNELQHMNENQLILYSRNIINDFVTDYTNYIFSDSLINCLDLMQKYEETTIIEPHNLQEIIINPAIKNLNNPEFTNIEIINDKYIKKIKPLIEKAIIDTNLIKTIENAENEIKQDLLQLVIRDEIPILYDIDKINNSIQNINTRLPRNIEGINIIQVENNDINELNNQIKLIKRKLQLKYHPDKNIGKEQEASENFIKINQDIQDIILCIEDEKCLKELLISNKRSLNDNDTNPLKKQRIDGGNSPESTTDTKPQRDFISALLAHNIRYFLKYMDALIYNDDGTINKVKFILIPHEKPKEIQIQYALYNIQLFIIWTQYIHLYNLHDEQKYDSITSHIQDTLQRLFNCTNPQGFNDAKKKYFGDFIEYENNTCEIDFTSDIEESVYDIFVKLLENETDNTILNDVKPSENFGELESIIDKNKSFVIDNSSKSYNSTKKITNFYEMLMNSIYCPIPSIIDGMPKCKHSKTGFKHKINIHDMKLHISDNQPYPNYQYNIDFTNKDENNVNMYAVFTVTGKEPIIVNENINLNVDKTETQLNAPNTLKELVNHMLKSYNKLSGKIQTRNTLQAIYEDFFTELGKKLIERLIKKSIGDWGQELYCLTKLPTSTDSTDISLYKQDKQLNQFLIGITEDRLSASRMLFIKKFATNINELSIVGAYSTNYRFLYGDFDKIIKYFNNDQTYLQSNKNKVVEATRSNLKNTTKKIRPKNRQPVPAKSTIKNTLPKPPVQNDIIQPEKKNINWYIQNLKNEGVRLQLNDIQNIKSDKNFETDLDTAISLYNYITTDTPAANREEKVNNYNKIIENLRKIQEEKEKAENRKRESEDTSLYLPPVQNINNKPSQPLPSTVELPTQPPVENIDSKPPQPPVEKKRRREEPEYDEFTDEPKLKRFGKKVGRGGKKTLKHKKKGSKKKQTKKKYSQ